MVNLGSSSSSDSGSSLFVDVVAVARVLNFNLPLKLNESNFSYWKVQVRAAVRALGLEVLLKTPRSVDFNDVSPGSVILHYKEEDLQFKKLKLVLQRLDLE
ncbi:hypothetical protein Syun_011904 [Stephania yunnanensis]|uniref:Uncharacterized protein n=1 Tax=Stephania yunnanensis TaxID=152371 RepID=A0AAP0JZ69_9MAGN